MENNNQLNTRDQSQMKGASRFFVSKAELINYLKDVRNTPLTVETSVTAGEGFFTVQDAAKFLCVSVYTVRLLILKGKLRVFKLNQKKS